MSNLVEELEYVRLYDLGEYWCIEDKVLTQYPVVSKAKTSTLYEMWFDLVELPNGDRLIARAYYPKSVPLKIVRNTLYSWNEKWVKKLAEVQPLLQMQQGGNAYGEQQAQPQQISTSEESADDAFKRLQEYMKYLR